MSEGHWLLIEDANMAPPDVLAALVPLLEGRSLVLPSRGEVIRAAPSFQLLATVTSAPGSSGGVGGHSTGGAYGSSQMVKVRSKCDVASWALTEAEQIYKEEQLLTSMQRVSLVAVYKFPLTQPLTGACLFRSCWAACGRTCALRQYRRRSSCSC